MDPTHSGPGRSAILARVRPESPGEPLAESLRGLPVPALRGRLAAYQGYCQRGVAPAHHLGLPSPFMTVIVTLDEPLQIARHLDRTRPAGRYDSLVGGLHTTPVVIAHDGAQSGIQLQVSPLASRGLFGVPAAELAGIDLAAEEILGRLAGELHERIAGAASWGERFEILDAALSRRLADERPAPRAVVQAWQLLLASGGSTPVAEIARQVGFSERHLSHRFRQEIGLTPKLAGRIVRFDRARRALQIQITREGRADIAGTAAECGYFDQSHLVRDFRDFTELPPSRWLTQEFGNVQDRALVPV